MSNNSIGKYILINPEDCPTQKELIDVIKRLRSDLKIIEKFPRKKDPLPEYISNTISFLELLSKNPRLNREPGESSDEA